MNMKYNNPSATFSSKENGKQTQSSIGIEAFNQRETSNSLTGCINIQELGDTRNDQQSNASSSIAQKAAV